jgi:CheY-like chemotaxis protein/AraC-like DNA-binding protein
LFDADKIEKILTNLITNAFKFTAPGGEISVGFKYLNSMDQEVISWAEISVRDTGKGIPPEMIDKIFDRFFQVSSSDTRDFEGTGIGLALTRELVDIYKGQINVESEVGKGSYFRIRLPGSRDQFNEDEMVIIQPETKPEIKINPVDLIESVSVEKEPQEVRITQRKQAKPVILIVEDNSDLRKYISQHLLDDYQVREAANGKVGFKKATECIPDLVISDLMMPEMDGMEMCRRLREDERTSHIPVIMLTARADRDSKLNGLETGADDYIIKPFDAAELQIRIKNLIAQRKKLQERFHRNYFIDDRITGLEDADERFLRKAKDIIDNHISDPGFNTESFSRYLGLSRSQLYRKLQGLADQSPGEFIRKLRLKHSLVLLDKGFDNIAQIAYQVGFSDPSYYARCFRKLYGVSPSEYAGGQRNPRTAASE